MTVKLIRTSWAASIQAPPRRRMSRVPASKALGGFAWGWQVVRKEPARGGNRWSADRRRHQGWVRNGATVGTPRTISRKTELRFDDSGSNAAKLRKPAIASPYNRLYGSPALGAQLSPETLDMNIDGASFCPFRIVPDSPQQDLPRNTLPWILNQNGQQLPLFLCQTEIRIGERVGGTMGSRGLGKSFSRTRGTNESGHGR